MVSALVTPDIDQALSDLSVVAIFYDSDGGITGGSRVTLDHMMPAEPAFVTVDEFEGIVADTVDLFVAARILPER